MTKTFNDKLKEVQLSKSEKHIVEVMTDNLSQTAFMGGTQLADRCKVSVSTITRLAQKLGYSGFPEMKKELESLYRNKITPYEMFQSFLSKSDSDTVLQKSIEQDMQNIATMRHQLSAETLDTVVRKIHEASTVYLAAIDISEININTLERYLSVVGKKCIKLAGHGLSRKIILTEIGPDDILIAVSFQKIFVEVRDAAVFAQEKGAATVAITDSEFSPLAMACDHALIAPVMGTTFGFTQAAPIAMVNVIANCLAALAPETALENLEKMKNRWNKFPVFCKNDE